MQAIIIAIMACFACTIITGMTGFIIYNSSFDSQPMSPQSFTPIPVLPTITIVQPTNTPFQTATLQPTLTEPPTATKLPTETIMPTPTLWFQVNAQGFIPTEKEMPSGYKIDTGGSGSIDGNHIIEKYMVSYTNNYPNDLRNQSGDPYLVVYISTIFDTIDSATSNYNAMDEDWVADNFRKMFNVSSNPQTISPSPVVLSIDGIERATAYVSGYDGVSIPGFFVFIKLQNHNGVFIVRTLSHAPFTNQQRAVDSAKYFTSLLVPKLIR